MSEEVNLSEESNNPEEVLAQKELLEDVVEIRQMIHQQRFAECNPMLFAIIKTVRTISRIYTVWCKVCCQPLSPV